MTTVNPTAAGRRVSLPAAVAWFAFAASLAFLVAVILPLHFLWGQALGYFGA